MKGVQHRTFYKNEFYWALHALVRHPGKQVLPVAAGGGVIEMMMKWQFYIVVPCRQFKGQDTGSLQINIFYLDLHKKQKQK